MARETKEDKQARVQREEAEAAVALAAYRATIPNRLMIAQAMAQEVGITTTITLSSTGPVVNFKDNEHLDETISYTTDEWELEYLERTLREKKEAQDGRIRRRGIAQDVWSHKLTLEEKTALKENIHSLY